MLEAVIRLGIVRGEGCGKTASFFCPVYQWPNFSSFSCSVDHSPLEVHNSSFSVGQPFSTKCLLEGPPSISTGRPPMFSSLPLCISHKLGKLTRPLGDRKEGVFL
jgi:hypothetical protein